MIELMPPLSLIEKAYAGWFSHPETNETAEFLRPGTVVMKTPFSGDPELPPEWIRSLIKRQVGVKAQQADPQAGDLIILRPPAPDQEESLPVIVALDSQERGCWQGWLVGAHVDYAGSQDLVLDSRSLQQAADPVPLAGMVQCWNPVRQQLNGPVTVLHRLHTDILEVIRKLAAQAHVSDVAPKPGHMIVRSIEGTPVLTGTPYALDDPRNDYLSLCRKLARQISDSELIPSEPEPEAGKDSPGA